VLHSGPRLREGAARHLGTEHRSGTSLIDDGWLAPGDPPMTKRPETKYAWNGDVALAFQVFGAGPVDLVYMQGYVSHVDLNWESQYLARFLRGLGERARVIHTDRRGWGCSDRFSPGDVAPLEVQVDDLIAVMDAAGSERA